MISKPKFTISNFTGMSGDGGIFYSDGFSVYNENGKSIIYEDYLAIDYIHNETSGFSNLDYLSSACFTNQLNNQSWGLTFLLNEVGILFSKPRMSYDIISGQVIDLKTLGSSISNSNGDLFVLPSGNLLITNQNYAILGVRGLCKSDSNSTKIIDKYGRNFVSLGLTSSSPNNKVVNLKTGQIYTITSISTTNSTNDTLNLASGGSNNNENEEFIAFVGSKFDLVSGMTIPSFNGQPSIYNWARQIKQYGDEFFVLNGNYLAKISADESTIDNKYKKLPANHQSYAFDINNDKILISSVSVDGYGYLLLWDGFSNGWNNILKLDYPTYAVKSYKNGWIYMSNGILFFTDGYQIQIISQYVDNEGIPHYNFHPRKFNGIEILNNKVYIACSSNNYNRILPGVYVYDINNHYWTYIKTIKNEKEFISPSIIYINPKYIYYRIEVGGYGFYNLISSLSVNNNPRRTRSFIYFIDLKEEIQIKEIQLVLANNYNKFLDISFNKYADIAVNIGDGRNGIFGINQVSSNGTTTSFKVYGNYRIGEVGDEIQFYYSDITYNNAGQRAYITNIENKGTNNETWTIEPALSNNAQQGADIRVIKVKKTERKTISINDLSKPIRFITNGLITDKLFIEVVVYGNSNPFNVSVLDIKVY